MPQKKISFLFLLLHIISFNFAFSQKISEVDKIVAKYPKSFNTTEKLAERIEKDFDSEAELEPATEIEESEDLPALPAAENDEDEGCWTYVRLQM